MHCINRLFTYFFYVLPSLKNMFKYWYSLVFHFGIRTQLLSIPWDHQNLLTLLVRCVDNTSVMTPESNWSRASFLVHWWCSCSGWLQTWKFGAPPRSSSLPLLQQLHWLPIEARVSYKLCCLMYRVVHGAAPSYLTELCEPCLDTRLRSTSRVDFIVPRSNRHLADRSFSVAAPSA